MARVTPATQQPPTRPRLDFGARVNAHTRYTSKRDGKRLPGVTTVTGLLDKKLTGWANRLGLDGINSQTYVEEAGRTGTLAHLLIEAELLDAEPVLGDFTANQVERVRKAVDLYHLWSAGKTLEPELIEAKLISENYRYGGTIDYWGGLDGVPTLLDYKTSGAIYREHKIQVLGGYYGLLKENGYPVKGIRILRFPYAPGEGLQEHVAIGQEVLRFWDIFRRCRELYEVLKGIR